MKSILGFWGTNRKAVGTIAASLVLVSMNLGWIDVGQASWAWAAIGGLTGVRMVDKKKK